MASLTAFATIAAQSDSASINWADVGNIVSNNDARATAVLLITENSEYLYATGIHAATAAIANGSTITAVTVTINGSVLVGLGETYAETVQIVTGGTTRVGNNLAANVAFAETADADHAYAGDWGVTFTAEMLKQSGFGCAFRATGTAADTVLVDSISFTIEWTLPTASLRTLARARNFRGR